MNIFGKFFNNKEFKPHQRLWLFCMLTFICGFFGGYTFYVRGNLFVNAQTGNLVNLSISIVYKQLDIFLFSLFLLFVYSFGLAIGEILKKVFKIPYFWENIILVFSLLLTFILGFLPSNFPTQIVLFLIAFLVALIYSTFEKAHGLGMATGFCTNHLKQTVTNFVRFVRDKEKEKIVISLSHLSMIISFVSGVSLATYLGKIYYVRTIWVTTFIFSLILILFNYSIKKDKK